MKKSGRKILIEPETWILDTSFIAAVIELFGVKRIGIWNQYHDHL